MRATYSRRAASKNSEVKKDEQPVIEKVSLFPLVLMLSDRCSFVPYLSVWILGRCC